MRLKDISFIGFFKIFIVVQAFIFLLTALIGLSVLLIAPDNLTINQPKLFGVLTVSYTHLTLPTKA